MFEYFSTRHLRNMPTRDMNAITAAEPKSYRQENEIASGTARLRFVKKVRPATVSNQRDSNLIITSDPSVSVRTSNNPNGANAAVYAPAAPKSFLNGEGIGLQGMGPMLGIAALAVVGIWFATKKS